jgi:pimeloyl-ACP methyl ester carboxylesterase
MGIPSMCFAHLEYPQRSESNIEKKFTVVHYDQRGFGKTYIHGHHGRKEVRLEKYVGDAESLVVNLRNRFGTKKMYVLGESWGSLIGVNLVARHPDWFYAYVGVGQSVKGCDMLNAARAFCLKEAEKEKNSKALRELQSTGAPVQTMSDRMLYKSMQTTGTWMDYYLEKVYHYNSDAGIFFKSLWEAPEYSFIDFEATLTSYLATSKRVLRDACFYNLQNSITSLAVPVYMVMGEYDFWTPITKKYYDMLQAPSKAWFELRGAGHMVRGDKPEEVERILVNKVLAETFK